MRRTISRKMSKSEDITVTPPDYGMDTKRPFNAYDDEKVSVDKGEVSSDFEVFDPHGEVQMRGVGWISATIIFTKSMSLSDTTTKHS